MKKSLSKKLSVTRSRRDLKELIFIDKKSIAANIDFLSIDSDKKKSKNHGEFKEFK